MADIILCAVDFSPDSEAALLWACRQAEMSGDRLVMLHVVHDPASSPGFYRKPGQDYLRPMSELAEEMRDDFLARMRVEHPEHPSLASLETQLVQGLPSGRIVEVAKKIDASLIVVGSRGRTGLPHILLGSVAERVVQTASMPVVVVKSGTGADE